MGWITLRIILAYMLPGFVPVSLLFGVLTYRGDLDLSGVQPSLIVLYVGTSLTVGVGIDLVRRKVQRPFIRRWNLSWFPYWTKKLYARIRRRETTAVPLHVAAQNYEQKLEAAVRFWIQTRLDEQPRLKKRIEEDPVLRKEYLNPTLTSGDWFALINVLEEKALKFYLEDYFSYSEFSFNFLISLALTLVEMIVLRISGLLDSATFSWALPVCLGLLALFHSLATFWMLASQRFVRKVLLYSIIKGTEPQEKST